MENQNLSEPNNQPLASDISLPTKSRKNFFQKLNHSQKVSLITLTFLVIVLPIATLLALIATRLNPRAFLPPTPPTPPTPPITITLTPTSAPVSEISCRLEVFPATALTKNPYSYGTPLDQNTLRVKPDQYYLYGLRIFNNSKTKNLGGFNVQLTQLHQNKEPISLINTDQNCTLDQISKTLSCGVPNNLGPGSSAMASAGLVVKILPADSIDIKTSSVYTVNSNLGTATCANMLFYSPAPTPTTCQNLVKTVRPTSACNVISATPTKKPTGIQPMIVKGVTGYLGASITCANGYAEVYRSPSCVSIAILNQIGKDICQKHSSCITPTPTIIPTPTPQKNAAPVITTSTLPAGTAMTTYSTNIAATDINLTDTLSMTVTGLPFGLYKGSCTNQAKGSQISCNISGFLIKAGVYPLQVKVSDNKGGSTTKTLNLTVQPPVKFFRR